MIPSTALPGGDSRPGRTTPSTRPLATAATVTSPADLWVEPASHGGKPTNHIPTTAVCASAIPRRQLQAYSVTGTHQGVSGCLACHGTTVNTTFDIAISPHPQSIRRHARLQRLGLSQHEERESGGFRLGTASLSSPTLTSPATPRCGGGQGLHDLSRSAPYWNAPRRHHHIGCAPHIRQSPSTTGDWQRLPHDGTDHSPQSDGSAAKPPNHIPTTAASRSAHDAATSRSTLPPDASGRHRVPHCHGRR